MIVVRIFDVTGGNFESETQFTIERPANDLVVSGRATSRGLSGKSIGDTLLVSGIRMTVRDRGLNLGPDGVTEELGFSSDITGLLRKASQTRIIYSSMSTEEYRGFKPTTDAQVLIKGADVYGRGGWTNKTIIQDIAEKAGISLVLNVYEYWIKQYELANTQPYVDAIMSLVGLFKPRAWFLNNTLYILQPKEDAGWTGRATFTSAVSSASKRESLVQKPYKLILTGGQGPFDPSMFHGTLYLGHRSGTVEIGGRVIQWRDWGSDRTDTVTVEDEQFDDSGLLKGVKITKTVDKQTFGIDVFGNDAYMREEIITTSVKRMDQPDSAYAESRQEHTFNDYSHEHWYWQQPRLDRTLHAIREKSLVLLKSGSPYIYDHTKYQDIQLFSQYQFALQTKDPVIFEETLYEYDDHNGGLLKHKIVRRRADCISFEPHSTQEPRLKRWHELHGFKGDSNTTRKYLNQALTDLADQSDLWDIFFFPEGIVYEEHTRYKQISRKYYQMTQTVMTLDPNRPTASGLGYEIKTTVSKVPAGKVPSSRLEPRTMTVYAEKILGGDGPNVEVSDPNIIDWQQAKDILEELAPQFTGGSKRFINIEIPGEIPVDIGWSMKLNVTHKASGIGLTTTKGFISSYSRTKDAGSGTVNTSIGVEEFIP